MWDIVLVSIPCMDITQDFGVQLQILFLTHIEAETFKMRASTNSMIIKETSSLYIAVFSLCLHMAV